jgi:predicted RNA binding protein YcfA (HicA-like mRNA interferase family)
VPRLTPCSREAFIRKLKNLGYDGPYKGTGGHPQFMSKPGTGIIAIPNPHRKFGGDIGTDLLRRILRDNSISRDHWENA